MVALRHSASVAIAKMEVTMAKSARKPVESKVEGSAQVEQKAPKAKRTRAENWAPGVTSGTITLLVTVNPKRASADNYAPSVAQGTITVLVTSNPKRANKKSAPRFDLYRTGMTVAEHTEAYKVAGFAKGLANADRRWDMAHGFIRIDQ